MPNHVTHKILFDNSNGKAREVFDAVCPDGKFDFEILVPRPLHVYRGSLGREEDQDFGELTWYAWNRKYWGTKWNCYGQSCGIDEDGRAFIQFDTAWSIPYPVIAAFNNRFQIPFIHKYFDEGHVYWGIEYWELDNFEKDHIIRKTKLFKREEDERILCIELKGHDPDEENE